MSYLPQGEGSSINGNGLYSSVSSNTTLDGTYYVVLCNASSAAFTITLPASSSNGGKIYNIKKTDSSGNAVTIDGNASETIDGDATKTLNLQYESITIICDGSNWHIL